MKINFIMQEFSLPKITINDLDFYYDPSKVEKKEFPKSIYARNYKTCQKLIDLLNLKESVIIIFNNIVYNNIVIIRITFTTLVDCSAHEIKIEFKECIRT